VLNAFWFFVILSLLCLLCSFLFGLPTAIRALYCSFNPAIRPLEMLALALVTSGAPAMFGIALFY
jgi:hypothetical protein